MSHLQILHEALPNAMIVTIIGQMDESNVDAEAPKIYALIDQIPFGGTLILNFSGLEYMNSKSIGYTMDFYNKMVEKGGNIMIAEAQEQITDILNVVGITNVIPMVESVSEARAKIGASISSNIIHESVAESIPEAMMQESRVEVVPESIIQPQEELIPEFIAPVEENMAFPIENIVPAQEIIEEKKIVYGDIASEISEQMKMKQSLSQKQEDALENFLQDNPSIQEVIPEQSSIPKQSEVQNSVTSSSKQEVEKEFPLLAVSVIVGLVIILAVLFLK